MLSKPNACKAMLKNKTAVVALALVLPGFAALKAQNIDLPRINKPAVDSDRTTSVGNIGLTVTNYGTFGDGFLEQNPDRPSCEYPLGSGIEHIFDGGLWVGARRADGSIVVTTGAVDVPSLNFAVNSGFEFTTSASAGDVLRERSSLFDSPFFDPEAVSHQDFIADFTDSNVVVPGTFDRIPNHVPMNISVHLETYAWNFPFADAFVIFNYNIRNTGRRILRDLYIGLWADLVVRNTKITPSRVGAPFYQHVGNGYVDSLHMAYAFDFDGDPGFTDPGLYVALKLLGAAPPANETKWRKRTNYGAWLFRNTTDPIFFSPQDDITRYDKMAEGMSLRDIQFINDNPGNYMTLIATGPFSQLDPDSTINIAFAVICAPKVGTEPNSADTETMRQRLYENARWAQRAYNGEDRNGNGRLDPGEDLLPNGRLDRYVLPTPPPSPKLHVEVSDASVDLYWDALTSETARDLITGQQDFEGYRVYRTQLGADGPGQNFQGSQTLIAQFDSVNGIGYDTGLRSIRLPQPLTFPGETRKDPDTGEEVPIEFQYHFHIDNLLNGWQYGFSVTAFDRGDPELNLGSLESSRRENFASVFPGTPVVSRTENGSDARRKVGVYPNPYRSGAVWDGVLERQRKLYFYNLPARCEVRIFTLAGDLVDVFQHDAATYAGEGIQWFDEFAQPGSLFSGGEHAWDLVTRDDQALASGLYLYTVEDLEIGEVQTGKFLVIK